MSNQSLVSEGSGLSKMDIHVTNRTNKSWKIIYIIKVRQLFSKQSKILLSLGWRVVQT